MTIEQLNEKLTGLEYPKFQTAGEKAYVIHCLGIINDLQSQLSSKSQECRDFEEGAKQWKATAEWYQKENELLHKQYTELCNRNSDSDSTQDQPSDIESENDRLTAELASLRAERDKWKEDCINNANRAMEIVAERDKWHVLADEHSATALEFSDSLRDVRADNERLKDQIKETELNNNRDFTNLRRMCADKEIELRKRCEDLEAEIESMKKNRRCSIG